MQRFQRFDDEGWFKVGTVEVTTSVLVAAVAAITMVLGVFVPGVFRDPLYFEGGLVRSGEVWRVVTWPFSERIDIWPIISMAMMVLVGSEIERELRRRRYAWLIGALVLLPPLLSLWAELSVGQGLSQVVGPLFVVYVLWRPGAQWFFGIPLWVLVVVFEVIELLRIFDLRNQGYSIGGLLTFWAAGIAVAVLGTRAFGITEFHQIPKLPLPQFVTGDPYAKANRQRAKAQKQQMKGTASAGRSGGRTGGPKIGRTPKQPADVIPIRPEPRLDRESQADMDTLLDKISATGMDSLSAEERRRLDDLSRRLRGE